MSDRISESARCPFFRKVIRSKRMACIECESFDINLGFDTAHLIRLRNGIDLRDYAGIFCCDMYETCPTYKAIYNAKYKEEK